MVHWSFNGQTFEAQEGQTVATALWAQGVRALRLSLTRAQPRGIFCGMGICYDCLVRIEGRAVRACMTLVSEGLEVESGE